MNNHPRKRRTTKRPKSVSYSPTNAYPTKSETKRIERELNRMILTETL
jgi:hypothetical protein